MTKAAQGCAGWQQTWQRQVDRLDPDVVAVLLGPVGGLRPDHQRQVDQDRRAGLGRPLRQRARPGHPDPLVAGGPRGGVHPALHHPDHRGPRRHPLGHQPTGPHQPVQRRGQKDGGPLPARWPRSSTSTACSTPRASTPRPSTASRCGTTTTSTSRSTVGCCCGRRSSPTLVTLGLPHERARTAAGPATAGGTREHHHRHRLTRSRCPIRRNRRQAGPGYPVALVARETAPGRPILGGRDRSERPPLWGDGDTAVGAGGRARTPRCGAPRERESMAGPRSGLATTEVARLVGGSRCGHGRCHGDDLPTASAVSGAPDAWPPPTTPAAPAGAVPATPVLAGHRRICWWPRTPSSTPSPSPRRVD